METSKKRRRSFKGSRAYRVYRESLLYDTVRAHLRTLQRIIRLPPYLGSEYQCPVCGIRLRAYKPIGILLARYEKIRRNSFTRCDGDI